METRPSSTIEIETLRLSAGEGFPNNPRLPLLVYRQALIDPVPAGAERILNSHDWHGTWRNGVFDFHHFHSNAHEVLVICAGHAGVRFGGPEGQTVRIAAGDVAVLPAGTAHQRIRSTGDFLVVGGYPAGQEGYDLLRGDPSEQQAAEQRIAAVPLPSSDPVYGAGGPLLASWSGC